MNIEVKMGGKRQIALLLIVFSLLSISALIYPADAPVQAVSQQDVYKKMIIYIMEDSMGYYQIGIMGLKGDEKAILTKHGNNWAPVVSSSGDRIAFYSDRTGTTNLWVMDATGAKQEQITFDRENINSIDLYNRGQIEWSQDSKIIYFIRNGDIWMIDQNGETPTALTKYHDVTLFRLSPDKEKVVFAREKTKRHNGLWSMNIDGINAKQISTSDIISPSINWADNQQLIYSTNRGIFLIEFSGVNNKFYKNTNSAENDVEWCRALPDKNSNPIAYIAAKDGLSNIFTAKPDGSQETQLTTKGGFSPYWVPDGKAIVYIEGNDMYLTNLAEKDKLRLSYSFSVYYPVVADIKVSSSAAK
jgi:Tol biopolymer transport system component